MSRYDHCAICGSLRTICESCAGVLCGCRHVHDAEPHDTALTRREKLAVLDGVKVMLELGDAKTEIATLRARLDALCDAAEDAIGFACQHDRNGFVTFIDRSQPVAQYSDDGPDAWPARLHAAIAAIRALPSAPAPLPWTEGALISALTRTEMNRYQAERVALIVLAGPGGKP